MASCILKWYHRLLLFGETSPLIIQYPLLPKYNEIAYIVSVQVKLYKCEMNMVVYVDVTKLNHFYYIKESSAYKTCTHTNRIFIIKTV